MAATNLATARSFELFEVRQIPQVPGALANSLGQIKWPELVGKTRGSGTRLYRTKWIWGCVTRAGKKAAHSYMGTMYRKRNYKIHQLICAAFHGPKPFPKAVVLHLDEDGTNNRPENLRWGTQKENLNAPGFLKYCRGRTGENSPSTKGMKRKRDR